VTSLTPARADSDWPVWESGASAVFLALKAPVVCLAIRDGWLPTFLPLAGSSWAAAVRL